MPRKKRPVRRRGSRKRRKARRVHFPWVKLLLSLLESEVDLLEAVEINDFLLFCLLWFAHGLTPDGDLSVQAR